MIIIITIVTLVLVCLIIASCACIKNEYFTTYKCPDELIGPQGDDGVCDPESLLGNILSTTQFTSSTNDFFRLKDPTVYYFFPISSNYKQGLNISDIQFWVANSPVNRDFSYSFYTRLSGIEPGDSRSENRFIPLGDASNIYYSRFNLDQTGFVNYKLYNTLPRGNNSTPETFEITGDEIRNKITGSSGTINFNNDVFRNSENKILGDPVIYIGMKMIGGAPNEVGTYPKLFCNKNIENTDGIGEVSWTLKGNEGSGDFPASQELVLFEVTGKTQTADNNQQLLPIINVWSQQE
jgi:hypothetical protein